LADAVYGSPIYNQNHDVALNGTTKSVSLTGIFKAGNNYNIRVTFITTSNAPSETSSISYLMVATSSPDWLGKSMNGNMGNNHYILSHFNGTDSYTMTPFDYPDNFPTNIDLILQFTVQGTPVQIVSAQINIKIFQNPNRPLSDFIGTLALWLLIPGIIIIFCGACVSGNTGKSGSGSKRSGPIRRASR
jgi:hypothetical protein